MKYGEKKVDGVRARRRVTSTLIAVKDMVKRRSTGWEKVPVGVLETHISLLDFIRILQFGNIVNIHGHLRHGLLKNNRRVSMVMKMRWMSDRNLH